MELPKPYNKTIVEIVIFSPDLLYLRIYSFIENKRCIL